MSESIKDISDIFADTDIYDIGSVIKNYENDKRSGVQKLIDKYKKKLVSFYDEMKRLDDMLFFEKKYIQDAKNICGIDEAGRGPFAGPVVAGAVVLDGNLCTAYEDSIKDRKITEDEILLSRFFGLNDSKKVSAKNREKLYDIIKNEAISYGIGVVSAARIDEINILSATYEAMRLAISDLSIVPDILLNDAVTIPDIYIRQAAIVKGDEKSLSIAAASIMAKVTRDRMMAEYASLYPKYQFESNKGYGSAEHIKALKEHGPCPIHRATFIHSYV